MVAKAPAKTPPRQRSKFSAIFDALVATPPVKTEPLPEMRRTFVNQNPDEEFMRMNQMMNMRSPMATPKAAPAAASAMRMHSGSPNMPSRQTVPFDPSLPFDPSMPIGVAATPGRRPEPAPAPAAPRPPEKRMDTLLRGIGNFLGYIPKGGSRGDRTEMIADFARGLLGEKPIREEEAELNQRMAEEMLRRALATGDVNEIARLDPDMAMKLQEFGTFDEDRANIRQTRLTQKQIDDAAIEENRVLSARRVVEGLYEATGGDPAAFSAAVQQIAQENPNVFNTIEMDLAGNPDGMRRYFAVAATGTGSRAKPYAVDHPEYGPIMYDPNSGQYMFDANGQPVRPYAPQQRVDLGPGLVGSFNPVVPALDMIQPGGAPVQDVTGQGFPPPPGTAGGTPVAAPVGAPGQMGGGSLQDQVVEAEARQAGAVTMAQETARARVANSEAVALLMQSGPPAIEAAEDLEAMTDEQLGLISGMPSIEKARLGGAGFIPLTAPESPAAIVMNRFNGLLKDVRQIGFDRLKGAGQVTEAESKFAADAIANLEGGRYANAAELRREINSVRSMLLLAITTRNARDAALAAGDLTLAADTSEGAIMLLREKYGEAQVAPPGRASTVPMPSRKSEGSNLPRATNPQTGQAVVYRNGQWVPE